jgi:hypothetical protein
MFDGGVGVGWWEQQARGGVKTDERLARIIILNPVLIQTHTALPPSPALQQFVRRCGTPLYMAPEIFRKDYHVQADM